MKMDIGIYGIALATALLTAREAPAGPAPAAPAPAPPQAALDIAWIDGLPPHLRKSLTKREGQTQERTTFMSWAIDVTGSAEAAKRYFRSIREVAGHPGMWLSGSAAARFEAALKDFETKHPGYTFPDTDVAQAFRGRYSEPERVGMLGHPLGVAFDFFAYDNPNLDGEKGEHAGLNAFMLKKFGADPADPKHPGRATMSLGRGAESKIEQAGKNTMLGKTTPADDAIVDQVRQQFDEMVATSERFKASMAGHMQELRDARDLYFEQRALEDKLKHIPKNDQAATKQRLDEARLKVKALIESAFQPWTKVLTDQIAADQAQQAASAAQEAELKSLASQAELADFAKKYGLSQPAPRSTAAKQKAALTKEIAAKLKYNAREIVAVQALIHKLADPEKIFGGVKQADGHWAAKRQSSGAPVMQYLEHGFIRNDDMPNRAAKGARKQVFNAEVAATLARYGWSPGATYGDTMHFDFIEGYAEAVPGGRSNRKIFGPDDDDD
jgi:hypothetical protein